MAWRAEGNMESGSLRGTLVVAGRKEMHAYLRSSMRMWRRHGARFAWESVRVYMDA